MPEIIKDKKYYESFMMHHMGNHQVPAMLSLDVLGNGKIDQINEDQKLCLNANLVYLFDDRFVIINGNKLNVDAISLQLIQYLFEHPYSSVADIIFKFNSYPADKIKKLLFQLALENIIGLVT